MSFIRELVVKLADAEPSAWLVGRSDGDEPVTVTATWALTREGLKMLHIIDERRDDPVDDLFEEKP